MHACYFMIIAQAPVLMVSGLGFPAVPLFHLHKCCCLDGLIFSSFNWQKQPDTEQGTWGEEFLQQAELDGLCRQFHGRFLDSRSVLVER